MRDVKIAQAPEIEMDAVTLDIIEGALKNARHEMDAVLFRTAMSPVIREQHDEFPMITDPQGRMVVGQFGSYIGEMMESYDDTVEPGDVLLTSDPYRCGGAISHINDWLVLVPIFFDGELVGWSSMFGHQMDAGGPLPGSLPTGAKTVFGEGLRIPPVKIFRRGEAVADVIELILNNVRMPEMNRADLMAIVAGCRTAEKRIQELCRRFGTATYLAACRALLERTHRAMRQLIVQNIPEEPQSFEDWIDDDGLGNGPYKMKLTLWREGEEAYFDWSGTDPQAVGVGDEKATAQLRRELRAARGAVKDFDLGPPLEEILARCREETGLAPPTPQTRPLSWAPVESAEEALRRVRGGSSS